MGVSWSKESSNGDDESTALGKRNLILIFQHIASLEEMAIISQVSRRWASLLGTHIIPQVLGKYKLHAWYDSDTIKLGRTSRKSIDTCAAWHSNPEKFLNFLKCFRFTPSLLESYSAQAPERPLRDMWSALARISEPRVVTTSNGLRCVQFIDGHGTNTVYLQSTPFKVPVPQPITIFCVAIAFDEVTYLSGIRNRFELCHAYPSVSLREHDRAPVAMTAQPVDDSSDTDDPSDQCVVTGDTRPGQWHLYSAVYNGDESELFVDGISEGGARSNVGTGFLDGLTLGTDHRNDFPLGSTTEGTVAGAMGEVVVFGSVLDSKDREVIERQLMRKHGIEMPSTTRTEERAKFRQANTMLVEPVRAARHAPCPLKYLTKHPNVAWSFKHPVSGALQRPKRIGVRETAESSDW